MRAARVVLAAANLGVAAAVVATYATALGRARWHDEAAYAALAVLGLALLPLWRRRAIVTLVLASAGAWSLLTGVLLVYVTPWMPSGRWMTWWHAATSAAFALAFLAHWARNNARLWMLVGKLVRRPPTFSAALLLWGIALSALAATFVVRADVTETRAWHAGDAALVVACIAAAGGVVLARKLDAQVDGRHRARGATDATLLAAMLVAAATGYALAYASNALRAEDAYWPTIAWHLLAGYALAALVAWHVAFNARPLVAHAR